jgi:gas vesicle protein GvpN
MLLFGDDEFKTSDLIGNQSGYTRKKVVDNYIHSVVKVEDELRHNWTDSRLTLACREGFTMVYDEFNRSRPEVNNVLLSALEEKLLVLPPSNNRAEYIRVSPHFRAILTSNPEEYCGVHGTQDALQDRLITINMPEPDELAQQQILVQKVGIDGSAALQIVQLVKTFQASAAPDMVSSLRPSLMIATICHDHGILPLAENADFRNVCSDILLARSKESVPDATRHLWNLFNRLVVSQAELVNDLTLKPEAQPQARLHGEEEDVADTLALDDPQTPVLKDVLASEASVAEIQELEDQALSLEEIGLVAETGDAAVAAMVSILETETETETDEAEALAMVSVTEPDSVLISSAIAAPASAGLVETQASSWDDIETRIFDYLDATGTVSLVNIETALGLNRFQVVSAIKSMLDQGLIEKQETDGQLQGYQLSSN